MFVYVDIHLWIRSPGDPFPRLIVLGIIGVAFPGEGRASWRQIKDHNYSLWSNCGPIEFRSKCFENLHVANPYHLYKQEIRIKHCRKRNWWKWFDVAKNWIGQRSPTPGPATSIYEAEWKKYISQQTMCLHSATCHDNDQGLAYMTGLMSS